LSELEIGFFIPAKIGLNVNYIVIAQTQV
jgi:hypothetical protein